MDGIVRKKFDDKGYGFISPSTGGDDMFFHSSALRGVGWNDLRAGDRVRFETEASPKGPRATDVCRSTES